MKQQHKYQLITALAATAAVATLAIINRTRLAAAATTAASDIKRLFMGKYFTVSELCNSEQARKHNIDNTPSPEVRARLEMLIENCLDPVRSIYGRAIIVSSGYRCTSLNQIVGGVKNSQHLTGEAADLVPATGGSLADIFRAVLKHRRFDQLIIERNASGKRWIHVSYTTSRPLRYEVLSYENGKYYDIEHDYERYL